MDFEYVMLWVAWILFICAAMFVVMMGVEGAYYKPYCAEAAQNMCVEQGYDVYTSYSHIAFTKTPLGVKCGYVDYSRKNINIDSDKAVAVI